MTFSAGLRAASVIPLFSLLAFGQQLITTVAGTEVLFRGEGAHARDVALGHISELTVDSQGRVIFPDLYYHSVLRVETNGTLTVIAGNNIGGYSGDGGPARLASLNSPKGVAVDSSGNVYISDADNHRIRKVTPDGIITTYAGTGVCGLRGDAGPATSAQICQPLSLAIDSTGNLFVNDRRNNVVRRVTPDGNISTVNVNASQMPLAGVEGMAVDAQGNLYLAEFDAHRIRRISPDGRVTIVAGSGRPGFSGDGGSATAATLTQPGGVAVDREGNLFIMDTGNQRVRRVTASGTISTIGGTGSAGLSGDGGPALRATFRNAFGLAISTAGDLYIADRDNFRIRRIAPDGTTSTAAGNGQWHQQQEGRPAVNALLVRPFGISIHPAGGLLVADQYDHLIRHIQPDGSMRLLAGNGALENSGDGGPATQAGLAYPAAVSFDRSGNFYIADAGSHTIRVVGANGVIRRFAGNGIPASSGDNGPASQASLSNPASVVADSNGNIYIADFGNARIRRVSNGTITTFANIAGPTGLAFDANGNLIVADIGGRRIARVNSAGVVTTIAGGGSLVGRAADGQPATSARLNGPATVAVDASGRIFFTDANDVLVRFIATNGTLQTLAGTGRTGYSGDGGPATAATFREPWGIAVGSDGTVYVADSINGRIRAIVPARPSFATPTQDINVSAVSNGAVETVNIPLTATFTGLNCEVSPSTQAWLTLSARSITAPGTLQARIDPARLAAGTHRASIEVTCAAAQPAQRTINIIAAIQPEVQPKLSAESKVIHVSLFTGADRNLQQINVRNSGSGSLNLTVRTATETGGEWLVAEAPSSLTPAAPGTVDVYIDPAQLQAGTYNGTVTLTGGNPDDVVTVPVRLTLNPSQGKIAASHKALTFTAVAGGGAPLPQDFLVTNAGTGVLPWQVRSNTLAGGAEWLRLNTDSGRTTASGPASSVEVGIAPGSLTPGTYYGQVQISSDGVPNSPQTVTVVLNVLDAAENPGPEVRPVSLSFGTAAGAAPGAQVVRIANLGNKPLSYTSTRSGWLSLAPSNATIGVGETVRLVVQPDLSGLGAGNHDGAVDLRFDDGSTRKIAVGAIIPEGASTAGKPGERSATNCAAAARVDFDNGQMPFRVRAGQTLNLAAAVKDNCGVPVTTDRGNVRLAMQSGDTGGEFVHSGTGKWSRSWQARASNSGTRVKGAVYVFLTKDVKLPVPIEIPIEVNVTAGGAVPMVEPGALRNAASFDAFSPVAPGMLITLVGQELSDDPGRAAESEPLPTELNNTEVRLGDKSLRLLYSSSGQINAQVPFDLSPETEHQVLVRRGAALSVPEGFIVASAAPAIFALDSSGSGQAAALNIATGLFADASNPVKAGDTLRIYCTGLGRVTPELEPGLPAPPDTPVTTVLPAKVTIGGVEAAVTFSGLSPGVVGRYQVDVTMPEGIAPGDTVPVTIAMGSQTSKALTIAVR